MSVGPSCSDVCSYFMKSRERLTMFSTASGTVRLHARFELFHSKQRQMKFLFCRLVTARGTEFRVENHGLPCEPVLRLIGIDGQLFERFDVEPREHAQLCSQRHHNSVIYIWPDTPSNKKF